MTREDILTAAKLISNSHDGDKTCQLGHITHTVMRSLRNLFPEASLVESLDSDGLYYLRLEVETEDRVTIQAQTLSEMCSRDGIRPLRGDDSSTRIGFKHGKMPSLNHVNSKNRNTLKNRNCRMGKLSQTCRMKFEK